MEWNTGVEYMTGLDYWSGRGRVIKRFLYDRWAEYMLCRSGVGGCSDPPGWMDPRSIHPRVFGPGGSIHPWVNGPSRL